eukprot:3641979-Prymnesium_polylepis.1
MPTPGPIRPFRLLPAAHRHARVCRRVARGPRTGPDTRMLERAGLNGARSCNHSSKPRAVVHR